MAAMFKVIPETTFQNLQTDAGVLLTTFNPSSPAAPSDSAIVCATTGGISVSCQPEFEDWGEDIDNCPNNTKELKRITGWNCTLSTTALNANAAMIKRVLGAADLDGTTKIVPRAELAGTDFADLWWVGDKAGGGLVAVKILNALSTGGFQLQTTKNGKGQLTLEITGHVSITSQDTVPMEFYSTEAASSSSSSNPQ